jgi:hypothetical protein
MSHKNGIPIHLHVSDPEQLTVLECGIKLYFGANLIIMHVSQLQPIFIQMLE